MLTLTQNKRLAAIVLFVSGLLCIPLIAQFPWDLRDFVIAGFLLFGTGLSCELVLRKVKSPIKRIIFCGLLLLVLFLVWAELAVGIFGTPFAGS